MILIKRYEEVPTLRPPRQTSPLARGTELTLRRRRTAVEATAAGTKLSGVLERSTVGLHTSSFNWTFYGPLIKSCRESGIVACDTQREPASG